MKVIPPHYAVLKAAIISIREAQPVADLAYYQSVGLTAKRWRWDLLWSAQHSGLLPARFIEDVLYTYCNDDHIDTALRRITA